MTAPGKPATLRPQRKPQTTGGSDTMQKRTETPARPAEGGDPNSCPSAMNPAIIPGHSQLRSPSLEVPRLQSLVIDEAVRLFEPHDLVGMEYAWQQRHDAGAYRHRQEADRQQCEPIARQEAAFWRLGQSLSGAGKRHRTPSRLKALRQASFWQRKAYWLSWERFA